MHPKKTSYFVITFFVVMALIPMGCVSDSMESLNDGLQCDTLSVSYNNHIKPIMENHCLGCHSAAMAEAGVELDSYEKVKQYGESGQLLGTISHSNGYTPMPYELPKLSDCEIATVRNWINSAYPEP